MNIKRNIVIVCIGLAASICSCENKNNINSDSIKTSGITENFVIDNSNAITNKISLKEAGKTIQKYEGTDWRFTHSTNRGTKYNHENYVFSYSEDDEQSEWVAYELTREEANSHVAQGNSSFEEDPIVTTQSASTHDYITTGYDRGHMAPVADMRFSQTAFRECYYMSNMSPQIHDFNSGIWAALEDYVRYWARVYGRISIVTGPVLSQPEGKLTKTNKQGVTKTTKITIPKYHYKIIFDPYEPAPKMIAFVMPNKAGVKGSIMDYAVTVREVEELTGIDFFNNLPKDIQDLLESEIDIKKWKIK